MKIGYRMLNERSLVRVQPAHWVVAQMVRALKPDFHPTFSPSSFLVSWRKKMKCRCGDAAKMKLTYANVGVLACDACAHGLWKVLSRFFSKIDKAPVEPINDGGGFSG